MIEKKKAKENTDIKQFKTFVNEVLGEDEADLFLGEYNERWENRIEKEEPELNTFVLNAMEFDNAACAVVLMNDWMKSMNKAENYEAWKKKSSVQKQKVIDDYYFQIKTNTFRADMAKFGGREGVVDKLLKSSSELRKKNYKGALELVSPLLSLLDNGLFISNDRFKYVSIMEKIDCLVYEHYYKSSSCQTKNINFICPIEDIFLRVGAIHFFMENYSDAKKCFIEALKWNPVSKYSLWYLSQICLEQKEWNDCYSAIVCGLKYACRSSHFKAFYDALMAYFSYNDLDQDALCCNYLKMQYISSDEERKEVALDFNFLSKRKNRAKKREEKLCNNYFKLSTKSSNVQSGKIECWSNKKNDVTIEDIRRSSQKYGYPTGVNSDLIEITQAELKKAISDENKSGVEYFESVLSDLTKCNDTLKISHFEKNHVGLNIVN